MVKKRSKHFLVLSVKFTAILDFETLRPVTKSSHLHTHIFVPDLFMKLTANSKLNFGKPTRSAGSVILLFWLAGLTMQQIINI